MSGIAVLILRLFLALSLYVFLAWAIFILWRELQQQSHEMSSRRIPKLELTWQVDHQPTVRQFNIPEVTLGRDPTNDCPLPNETISARHARLAYHHRQWWLEDLQSTNGTFINQERVDGPTVIVSGDELRCGQLNLSVNIKEK